MKNFILSIPKGVPTIVMILVACYFSFAKNPLGLNAFRGSFPYAPQVGHLILYFFVALVFILDYAKSRLPHHSKINQEIGIAVAAAVLSLVLEIMLMWSFTDNLQNVFASAIGALLAFLFYHFWLLHPMRHYLYHSIQHHWRYQNRRKKKK